MDKFSAAGYGGQNIGIGNCSAILLVDFQKGFTDPRSILGKSQHVDSAVETSAKFLRMIKDAKLPVASCRTSWASADEMAYWKVSSLYSGDFFHGHEFTELDPRIANSRQHYEFVKTAPSIFFKTPLTTWLTKKNVDTVFVLGCTTSGCVRASAVDSFSLGFRTIVVEDCCGDQDLEAHESNLRDMGRRYADVLNHLQATEIILQKLHS